MVALDYQIALEVASHEAIVRQAYKDSVGKWTWSVGITSASGHKVEPYIGKTQPMQKCVDAYVNVLEKYAKVVRSAFGNTPLSREQFAAALSFHWNTGKIKSATWVKNVKAGDLEKARKNFMLYRIPPEIISRRKKEAALFFDGKWSNDGTVTEITKLNNKSQPIFSSGKSRDLKNEFKKAFESAKLDLTAPAAADDRETVSADAINPNSGLLPTHRPRQSSAITLATLQKYFHLLPEGRKDDAIYVVAIRGYYTDTMGVGGVNDRGLYDDAIFVIEPEAVHNFNGNTDPSRGKHGRAELKSPQVILYKPGLHGVSKGKGYPAFRQASPCVVNRDGIGEDSDAGKSFFWINLHRGSATSTSSEGCQTVPPNQWNEFKHLLDSLLKIYEQPDFCYLIVDENAKATEQDIAPTIAPSKPTAKPSAEVTIPQIHEPVNSETISNGHTNIQTTSLISKIVQILIARRLQTMTDAKPKSPDTSQNQLLLQILKILVPGYANPVAVNPKTPVNYAFGNAVGGLLDGRKTAYGILGLLATSLLPVLAPESGDAILQAFDLGASSGQESAAKGSTLLQSVFGALGSWGILGKVEKWIYLAKGLKK